MFLTSFRVVKRNVNIFGSPRKTGQGRELLTSDMIDAMKIVFPKRNIYFIQIFQKEAY